MSYEGFSILCYKILIFVSGGRLSAKIESDEAKNGSSLNPLFDRISREKSHFSAYFALTVNLYTIVTQPFQ